MPIRELLAMQRAGLSTLQAIRAATYMGARVCRLDGILGTVEPGKQADLLLIGGDPLQDLHQLLDVRGVYHAGVAIRPLTANNSKTSSRRIM
jgi:imidazolonepropionase-like amidohydrolase